MFRKDKDQEKGSREIQRYKGTYKKDKTKISSKPVLLNLLRRL